MADYEPDSAKEKKLSKEESDTILRNARADYDRAYDKEKSNISAAYEDLEFLAGAQWDEKQRAEREAEGRPCLTVNRLPQFVHQVTGDIRQMRPSIKVVPVDDEADPQVADIKGGLIRYIENRSDAAGIYFQAADSQVGCGIGHWRVLTEYADDSTFEQEIRIAGVDDGVSVLWDPDAKRLMKDDALYCFVPVDYSTEGFKKAFPNASPTDFSTLSEWANLQEWYSDSHIRVAEYWIKKPVTRTLALTKDGQTLDLTDDDDPDDSDNPLTSKEKIALATKMGDRIETRESYKVCRYLINAMEVLEGPEEWAGRYIPIVPLIGEEVRIGRKVIRNGIVRHAKDPQRMYNYGRSTQTEVFSLQPKAPFMVTELNVAKYQDIWNTANRKNWPYLPYEPDTKNSGAQPARIQPPVASQGVNEAVAIANEDMKGVTGIYDASLGNKSNETSGVAIQNRQREGDTGTYVYIDNFARAIRQTGRILIDLIPHVYDTERTIRIMGEDGRVDLLKINQAKQQINPQTGILEQAFENDVTVGSYDVVAEVGPSYTTRREEAKQGMLEFAKVSPQIAPLMTDLIAKAQDWPLADKIAQRARALIPPQILQAEEMEEQGADPEQVKAAMAQQQPQGPPPDPEKIAKAQQIQAHTQMAGEKHQAEMISKGQEIKAAQQKQEIDAQAGASDVAHKAQLQQIEMQTALVKLALANAQLEKAKQPDPKPNTLG